MPKVPRSPQKDQADLANAAARMLDAATAEPVPERILQLAKQLGKALAKARALLQRSDEVR